MQAFGYLVCLLLSHNAVTMLLRGRTQLPCTTHCLLLTTHCLLQARVAVQKKDKGRDGQVSANQNPDQNPNLTPTPTPTPNPNPNHGQSGLQLLTLRALAQLVTELTIQSKSADNPLRGALCLQRFVPPVGVKASVVRVHGRHGELFG